MKMDRCSDRWMDKQELSIMCSFYVFCGRNAYKLVEIQVNSIQKKCMGSQTAQVLNFPSVNAN
jgi:hypothetical protein